MTTIMNCIPISLVGAPNITSSDYKFSREAFCGQGTLQKSSLLLGYWDITDASGTWVKKNQKKYSEIEGKIKIFKSHFALLIPPEMQ